MQPAIYVINLDRATTRLAAVTSEVQQFGWSFERIEAIDARSLDEASLKRIAPDAWSRYQARRLTPGEICCLASHRKAWQRLIDDDCPWAFVLEDDAMLGPGVPAALRVFETQRFFDVVKLEGITTKPKKNVGAVVVAGPPPIFLMETVSAGAAACCITKDGARKLLAITKTMDREADFFMRQYGRTDLVIGEVRPFPASQDRTDSYIGGGRVQAPRVTGTARLIRKFVRARESLARRRRFRRLLGGLRTEPVSMDGSSVDAIGREL